MDLFCLLFSSKYDFSSDVCVFLLHNQKPEMAQIEAETENLGSATSEKTRIITKMTVSKDFSMQWQFCLISLFKRKCLDYHCSFDISGEKAHVCCVFKLYTI